MLLKSPRGQSKSESTLRANASETQVATQTAMQATKKTSVIVTEENLL